MRKLITTILVASFLLAFAGIAVAELDMDSKSYYVQGILALPTGDLGDQAGTGFGGGVGMKVPFSELLDFRGEVGYIMFGGEEYDEAGYNYDYSWSMIPIMVLGEYKLKAEDPFFLLGGVGLTIAKFEYDYDYSYTILGQTYSDSGSFDDSSTEFTLSVGAGYEINEQVNLEARFNLISDANYMSVHGTYYF